MKAEHDPNKCCPICGKPWRGRSPVCAAGLGRQQHRCDPKVLAAIDGAHRRTPDEEDPPHAPEARRLNCGLRWAVQDEREDGGDGLGF